MTLFSFSCSTIYVRNLQKDFITSLLPTSCNLKRGGKKSTDPWSRSDGFFRWISTGIGTRTHRICWSRDRVRSEGEGGFLFDHICLHVTCTNVTDSLRPRSYVCTLVPVLLVISPSFLPRRCVMTFLSGFFCRDGWGLMT